VKIQQNGSTQNCIHNELYSRHWQD
jgi:hypothetical protein